MPQPFLFGECSNASDWNVQGRTYTRRSAARVCALLKCFMRRSCCCSSTRVLPASGTCRKGSACACVHSADAHLMSCMGSHGVSLPDAWPWLRITQSRCLRPSCEYPVTARMQPAHYMSSGQEHRATVCYTWQHACADLHMMGRDTSWRARLWLSYGLLGHMVCCVRCSVLTQVMDSAHQSFAMA